MKLENAGTWRMANIMKKFNVDPDTARRLKAGEDVDVSMPTKPTKSTSKAATAESEGNK